jgi:DNA-binding cell septation regulator SpoVG
MVTSKAAQRTEPLESDQVIRVVDFRAFDKNSLRGFIIVALPDGMIVHGITLHEKNGSRWVGLPSKKFAGKDGTEGYTPIVEFRDRAALDRFRDAVLDGLDVFRSTKTSAPARAAAVSTNDGDGPPWLR